MHCQNIKRQVCPFSYSKNRGVSSILHGSRKAEEEDREPAWFKEISGREDEESTAPAQQHSSVEDSRSTTSLAPGGYHQAGGATSISSDLAHRTASRKRRAEEKEASQLQQQNLTGREHPDHQHQTSLSAKVRSPPQHRQQQQMRSPRGDATSSGGPSGSCVANYPPDLSFTSISSNFLRGIMRAAGGPLGIGRSSPAAG